MRLCGMEARHRYDRLTAESSGWFRSQGNSGKDAGFGGERRLRRRVGGG